MECGDLSGNAEIRRYPPTDAERFFRKIICRRASAWFSVHRRPLLNWRVAGVAAALALLLISCAKTGDPHPPIVLVPQPATQLNAVEYGDQVLLTVPMPTLNTDGSPVETLREIELLRRTESERASPKPLSDSEFLDGAAPILTIPADKVSAYLNGKILIFHDDLALSNRSTMYGSGFRYAVRFINKKRQNAGLSNQAFVAPIPIPPAPANLKAEVTQPAIRLRWDPPAANADGSVPARIVGYNVYRSEDPQKFPPAPLNPEPIAEPEFEDRAFQFDKTYYYAVSVIASRENPYAETRPSAPLELSPRDTFPPAMPQSLNCVVSEGAVLLLWAAPSDRDLAGYRITRREERSGQASPLQPGLVTALTFRDETVLHGRKYVYRVSAVDTHGNESPAAEVAADVP